MTEASQPAARKGFAGAVPDAAPEAAAPGTLAAGNQQ